MVGTGAPRDRGMIYFDAPLSATYRPWRSGWLTSVWTRPAPC